MYCGGISITSCRRSRSTRATVVGRAARLDPDSRRRQFGEEFCHLATPQLPPQHRLLVLVNPMNLKDMLGRIQTNSGNCHLDGSPWLRSPTSQPGTFDAVGGVHPNTSAVGTGFRR